MNHCRIFEVAIQQRFDADSKQAAQSNHLYRIAQQAAQLRRAENSEGGTMTSFFSERYTHTSVQVVVKGARLPAHPGTGGPVPVKSVQCPARRQLAVLQMSSSFRSVAIISTGSSSSLSRIQRSETALRQNHKAWQYQHRRSHLRAEGGAPAAGSLICRSIIEHRVISQRFRKQVGGSQPAQAGTDHNDIVAVGDIPIG